MRQSLGMLSAASVVIALATGAFPSAQDGVAPESGSISGWTLSRTFQPIADVEVTLACPPLRVQRAVSDASGRFAFVSPEGNCRVIARKEGYVETWFNGDPAPGGYGIAVRSGTTRDGIELQLMEGATIGGVISAGERSLPEGVRYHVVRREMTNGIVKLVPLPYAKVGRGGRFKTVPIPPGDYYVAASLPAGGEAGGERGFAVTYFPGTPSVGDATVITVKEGDRRDVSFELVTAPAFAVSGVVIDASGVPVHDALVTVECHSPPNWIRGSARTTRDGGFVIGGLQDGAYTVRASRQDVAGREEVGGVLFDVSGADVQHLTLQTAVR